MAIDGAAVLVLADVGGVYTPVAEQQGLSRESSRNMIETSHKQADHTQWIYGKKDDTLTLDALYVPGDAAMQTLRAAMGNKTVIVIRRSENGTEIEQATALISTISDEWPDNDASTVSVEFQLSSSWEAV